MICLALATKKSMRVCETSELRMTSASTSVEGSGWTPMRERSRVVSCYVLWNIIIILVDMQESATIRDQNILPLVLPKNSTPTT